MQCGQSIVVSAPVFPSPFKSAAFVAHGIDVSFPCRWVLSNAPISPNPSPPNLPALFYSLSILRVRLPGNDVKGARHYLSRCQVSLIISPWGAVPARRADACFAAWPRSSCGLASFCASLASLPKCSSLRFSRGDNHWFEKWTCPSVFSILPYTSLIETRATFHAFSERTSVTFPVRHERDHFKKSPRSPRTNWVSWS